MGMSAFVPDGYTETREINEIANVYPAVSVTFRVVTKDDLANFQKRTKNCDEFEVSVEVAKELAKRIVYWNVKDPKGEAIPATEENIRNLRSLFAKRLENVVFGFDPGDQEAREADAKN